MDKKEILRLSNMSRYEWGEVIKDHHKIIPIEERLTIYKEVISVLRRFNLNIYTTGGTLLGIIRDNNLIPWDDDIDMDMMYEEFVPNMYKIKDVLVENGYIVRLIETKEFPKMSFYKRGQKISICALTKKGKWRMRPSYRYKNKHFTNSKHITFNNMELLVPNPPEEYLSWVYGDWKKVIKSDIEAEYMNVKHFRIPSLINRIFRKLKRNIAT